MERSSLDAAIQVSVLLVIGAFAGVLSDATLHSRFDDSLLGPLGNPWVLFGCGPGVIFGTCVACLAYNRDKKGSDLGNAGMVVSIIWLCTSCFLLAELLGLLTGLVVVHTLDGIWLGMIWVAIPGFFSTLAMMKGLESKMQAYSAKQIVYISLLGSATAALLTLVDSQRLFYAGWQSIMLVAVGLPLLRKAENPVV